jgi:hypothetical protein
VTDVPNVTSRALRLRATLDPNDVFQDADRSNNAVEVVIPGCGDGIVQPGEQCDPAATPIDPCCQADCTLAPPGSPCEAPIGPCGTPDAPSPDGTSCGPGAPPCLLQVCHAGVCATETGSGGCLIGATCLLPGAPDPVDACQRCDPTLRTDSYSPNVDPDPAGLQCQATRLTRVLFGTTCSQRLERRVDRPLLRIHRSLNRLAGASPALTKRLARRLARDATRLERAQNRATQSGCDLGTFGQEVQVLMGQLSAYEKSVR